MAVKILSDNKLDQDLAQLRRDFDTLSKSTTTLMSSFPQLPPRERAVGLKDIQQKIGMIQKFFGVSRESEMANAGTRFTYVTLKTSFLSYLSRWRKFEKSI